MTSPLIHICVLCVVMMEGSSKKLPSPSLNPSSLSSPSSGGKKKVVIIGEMSDSAYELATNASASTNYALEDVSFSPDYDYDPPYHRPSSASSSSGSFRNRPRIRNPSLSLSSYYGSASNRVPSSGRKMWTLRKRGAGHPDDDLDRTHNNGMFVPVAAYSVTHSRIGNGNTNRRMRHPGRTTESAVYGYVSKPDIMEFKGQYFYGPNGPHGSAPSSSQPHVNYHEPMMSSPSGWSPVSSNRISGKSGGLGPGGLLLATLPLILAPMLSYLFTPMVIPVTATIAAGRRRRRRRRSLGSESGSPSHPTLPPHLMHLNEPSYSTTTMSSLFEANSTREEIDDLGDEDGDDGDDGDQDEDPDHHHVNRDEEAPSSHQNVRKRMRDLHPNGDSSHSSSSFSPKPDPRLKELQLVADYLRKVHYDDKDRDRAMANYLMCDGMLDTKDSCLQRLSCEFSDPTSSSSAPELDRAVTSILLGHVLSNQYIDEGMKNRLKESARFGQKNPGRCYTFSCDKIQQTFK